MDLWLDLIHWVRHETSQGTFNAHSFERVSQSFVRTSGQHIGDWVCGDGDLLSYGETYFGLNYFQISVISGSGTLLNNIASRNTLETSPETNTTRGFLLWTQHYIIYSCVLGESILVVLDIVDLISLYKTERGLTREMEMLMKISSKEKESLGSEGAKARVNRPETLKSLGNVDYLITDKTGTLTTPGPLKFVYCSIDRRIYGRKGSVDIFDGTALNTDCIVKPLSGRKITDSQRSLSRKARPNLMTKRFRVEQSLGVPMLTNLMLNRRSLTDFSDDSAGTEEDEEIHHVSVFDRLNRKNYYTTAWVESMQGSLRKHFSRKHSSRQPSGNKYTADPTKSKKSTTRAKSPIKPRTLTSVSFDSEPDLKRPIEKRFLEIDDPPKGSAVKCFTKDRISAVKSLSNIRLSLEGTRRSTKIRSKRSDKMRIRSPESVRAYVTPQPSVPRAPSLVLGDAGENPTIRGLKLSTLKNECKHTPMRFRRSSAFTTDWGNQFLALFRASRLANRPGRITDHSLTYLATDEVEHRLSDDKPTNRKFAARETTSFANSVSHGSTRDQNPIPAELKICNSVKPKMYISNSEAKLRPNAFKPLNPALKKYVDFDDMRILTDLRVGGRRSGMIDNFLKSMPLCTMSTASLNLQTVSGGPFPGPVTSINDFSPLELYRDGLENSGLSHSSSNGLVFENSCLSFSDSSEIDSSCEEGILFNQIFTRAMVESVEYCSPIAWDVSGVEAGRHLGYSLLSTSKRGILIEVCVCVLEFDGNLDCRSMGNTVATRSYFPWITKRVAR